MFVLLMSTVMELYMICFATCEIYVDYEQFPSKGKVLGTRLVPIQHKIEKKKNCEWEKMRLKVVNSTDDAQL